MLRPGDPAPSISLTDSQTGEVVSDPWRHGPVVLALFKVTCPTCHLAAPKVQALADSGVRVTAVGQDPPEALVDYAARRGQRVPTLSDRPPYPASDAFGVETVPTLFSVDADGTVRETVAGWDREGWNRLAEAWGVPPVSQEGDGLPSYRPG